MSVCLLVYFDFNALSYFFHANIYIILHYTVHDHALLVDIYTRIVVLETGMCLIYCRLDFRSSASVVDA